MAKLNLYDEVILPTTIKIQKAFVERAQAKFEDLTNFYFIQMAEYLNHIIIAELTDRQ